MVWTMVHGAEKEHTLLRRVICHTMRAKLARDGKLNRMMKHENNPRRRHGLFWVVTWGRRARGAKGTGADFSVRTRLGSELHPAQDITERRQVEHRQDACPRQPSRPPW